MPIKRFSNKLHHSRRDN